jgi:thiamine transport system ATP-binding protein
MLELDGVEIRQGAFRLRADFALAPGSRVALIGASGSGKSTLVNAIAGFVPLAAGRISWAGQDLGPLAPGERPLSILFQDQNLFAHMTVEENVALGLSPTLRLGPADRRAVAVALDRVGLAGFGPRRPGSLSGGEAGRVALARVLLRARPVMLLDEPFAALGPGLKADMLGLVDAIAAETGALVVMVTHDPEDARRFARDVVMIDAGEAAPPVPTAALFADPPPALRAYLGLRPTGSASPPHPSQP